MNDLDVNVWMVWVRAWGAGAAIAYALRMGFTREQILAANDVARDRAIAEAKKLADEVVLATRS